MLARFYVLSCAAPLLLSIVILFCLILCYSLSVLFGKLRLYKRSKTRVFAETAFAEEFSEELCWATPAWRRAFKRARSAPVNAGACVTVAPYARRILPPSFSACAAFFAVVPCRFDFPLCWACVYVRILTLRVYPVLFCVPWVPVIRCGDLRCYCIVHRYLFHVSPSMLCPSNQVLT